jgi:predicted permease
MTAWLFQTLARLRAFFSKPRMDAELEEELQMHVELATEENIKRGMHPDDARRNALGRFGSRDAARDLIRETRGVPLLDHFIQDVRYSIRTLGRSPLFALTATLSLAIGIGADTSIFTLADGLLFSSPAGVVEPSRLVEVSWTQHGNQVEQTSYPNYLDIRERAATLQDAFLYKPVPEPLSMTGANGAERIYGLKVSPNYFTSLEVRAAAGRLFNASDIGQQASSPVVLSHTFWTNHFRNDPSIVGQTLTLNGQSFGVVGIASEEFRGTGVVLTDVWIPFGSMQGEPIMQRRLGAGLLGARLKPGVSISQAAAEMSTIVHSLADDYPEENRGARLRVTKLSLFPASLVLPFAGLLTLLLSFVSLVLIIACANVAGVLLARAAARRREIAVRLAIGAGRRRLVRQFLTETMILFILGGTAGLLISRVAVSVALVAIPRVAPIPINIPLDLDPGVIAFAMGLSLIASLLCGLAPAMQASRADVVSALKDDTAGSPDRLRLRHAFVIGQFALTVVLVVAAGLYLRAIQRSNSMNLGFDRYGVELASINPSMAGYTNPAGAAFARALLERVRALPGVQAATMAAALPTGAGTIRFGDITIPGFDVSDRALLAVDWNLVEPGYFETMRIPFIAGRDFNAADRENSQLVAIVGEDAARRFWPGQDAVGKTILLYPPVTFRSAGAGKTVVVVGIAGDVQSPRSVGGPRPLVYMPLQQQFSPASVTIVARTTNGQRITNELRAVVASLNPNLPVVSAETLEEAIDNGLGFQRLAASVTGGLGIIGLLLATIGVYGVTAYAVARRTREIGIRMALGAGRANVVNMILWQGMSLVSIGSIIGLLFSIVVGTLSKRAFFGLPRLEPITVIASAGVLAIAGLAACYIPIRRATRIQAADALRHE